MLEERDGEGTNGMRKRRLLLEERGVGGGWGVEGAFPARIYFRLNTGLHLI